MSGKQELEPSEEVDERQLELARAEGDRYQQSVEYMITEIAETGAQTRAGDYLVGVAQEVAEGMYQMKSDRFEWKEPAEDENCHLEVVVADAADGRFLPHMSVQATVEDGQGTTVGPESIPFVWHPGLYHYGRNLSIPGKGTYTVTIDIEPATYPRHDEKNGDRYTEPVAVQFEDLQFTAGKG